MFGWLVVLLLGLSAPQAATASATQEPAKPAQATAEQKIDPEIAAKLVKIRRIYVENFGMTLSPSSFRQW